MPDRTGKRKKREEMAKRRTPALGYYIIVTDTEKTEKNYVEGLRKSIPEALQGQIVVKVLEKETANLLEEAIYQASMHPQYGRLWIIFDRDQTKDFDKIIERAERRGVCVGWSNPCLEIWFHAYLGEMPVYAQDPAKASKACCAGFEKAYQKIKKQTYAKGDPNIYKKLCEAGDEAKAIALAEQRYAQREREKETLIPSEMDSCTTVHRLVKEIKEKCAQL